MNVGTITVGRALHHPEGELIAGRKVTVQNLDKRDKEILLIGLLGFTLLLLGKNW